MAKKSTATIQKTNLYQRVLKIIRIHFYLILAYAGAIIVFDSWNLYTHEVIIKRWTYGAGLAVACCLLWLLLKKYADSKRSVTAIAYGLISADIIFAGLNVYIDRGMASKAIILFVIPLLVAAQLKSRAAVLCTAGLSVAAYSIALVRYFYIFYGEGLRIQLYGEMAFYSIVLFIVAALVLPLLKDD